MRPIATSLVNNAEFIQVAKMVTPPIIWQALYRMLVVRGIQDAERYGRVYEPWRDPEFLTKYNELKSYSLISAEGFWHIASRLRQSLGMPGSIYELGVYKGGSARLIREIIEGHSRTLRLFDTFAGMERTDPEKGDRHRPGDFADTNLDLVKNLVGSEPWIDYRTGWVPETFKGLEDEQISFAHIDLDLYAPILRSCEFIYPRLVGGGAIIFDDYGFPSTPGARRAIDEYFADKPEIPIVVQTGQAIVIKSPDKTAG